MANTLNASIYQKIARLGFQALRKKLVPLRAFTTDFSADVAEEGESVDIRVYPSATAAKSFSTATGSGGAGGELKNAIGDLTVAKKTVTLNQDPVTGFHFTDKERATLNAGAMTDTLRNMVESHANAVAKHVLDYVFNLLTAANFANSAFTGAASTFDLDDVIDINAVLADAGWPVDEAMKIAMVVKPTMRAALKKDNAIQDLSASGIPGVVARGALDGVDIFRIYQAPTLPPSGGTPESENLVGFVALPEAIAIATRTYAPQGQVEYYEVLTDEETGLSVVYVVWYDPNTEKMYHNFRLLYGATVCKGDALQRMKSA